MRTLRTRSPANTSDATLRPPGRAGSGRASRLVGLLSMAAMTLTACGGDQADEAPPKQVSATPAGLVWRGAAGTLTLQPFVSVGGKWLGPEDAAACTATALKLTCPAADAGTLVAEVDETGQISTRFTAAGDVTIEGLELRGSAALPGATAWLSNGFHSWSQTGAVALRPSIDESDLNAALQARGDVEVIREGFELSWWMTAIDGSGDTLVAAALDARRFRSWVQATREGADRVRIRLVSGRSGEAVAVKAGAQVEGEPWWVGYGPDLEKALAEAGDRTVSRRASHPVPADAGWNSWYQLWDAVTEKDVRANAALAGKTLSAALPEDAPPLRIVVDDGWQKAWGEWEPNEKFPSGLDGLAKDLGKQGFTMGVWLAPLLVDADSPIATEHPDWFVEGASYLHLKNGSMKVLDPTHPAAAAHLAAFIAKIVSWGYTLLKIDFLFAGTWEGKRHEQVTGMEAYNRALAIIREAAGPDTVLLAVGAPPLGTLRHVDAWRVGGDIAVENFGAVWAFLPSQLRTLGGRWFWCRRTLCDADPIILRDLPQAQVEFGAWTAAMAGGALFLSDHLPVLPPDRLGWGLDQGRAALGIAGFPGQPVHTLPPDPPQTLSNALFDHLKKQSTHVVPVLWRTQDGRKVALNATDKAIEVEGVTVSARSTALVP